MALKLCGICLEPNQTLIRVTLECGDNLTVLQKLQKVAPFQDWLDCYSICQTCKNLLESSYYFLDMCVKYNENKRKLAQKGDKLKSVESSNDVNLNTDSTDEDQVETEYITIEVEEKDTNEGTAPANTRNFQCSLCDKTFFTSLTLEMHSRIEHQQKCSVCLEVFIDTAALDTHIKNDHPGHFNKFTCEVCTERFSSQTTLIRHCEKQHSMARTKVRPYSCSLCDKRLVNLSNFRRHMNYHEGTRHFTCTFCGKTFITKKDLTEHERIHLNEKKYRCDTCDKRFNTYSNFRSHKYAQHRQDEWKYACDMCPKRFPWKAQLVEHIKRHKGIKEHQCLVCSLWFTTKHDMDRHMYFHTKDRPHKCALCEGRSYRDKTGLRGHMLKHHGAVVHDDA